MTLPPESTDDCRTGSPLPHAQYAAIGPVALSLGGSLPHVDVAYETWGTLSEHKDNVVLVCHAISGDSHAARHDAQDTPGWWDGLIGPGGFVDTDRFFVICPNVLGGCRGTTGPASIHPETGRPYGTDFPDITIDDMVDVQAQLLSVLGITRLKAVVGGSLGGHQALAWATRYPDRVATCVAVATSPRLTSQALAFDVIARNAIQRDPHFHDGQYYDQPNQPKVGLAIARMLGHITYLSGEAMEAKFDPDRHSPRSLHTAFEKRFSVGSYLAHQGEKFVARFDANSYVTITTAMDLFDLGRTHEQRVASLSQATCDFLLVSFSSDWLFTPAQSRELVAAIIERDTRVAYCEISTDAGHDGFLLPDEMSQYGPLIAARLGDTDASSFSLGVDDEQILELIPHDASVLDLGCGMGELLATLRNRGQANICGVEVDQDRIIATARRGLNVIDFDLNRGLPGFADQSFDIVVLSATLQAVRDVERLFDEMLRVGRRVIISFANFAYRDLRESYVNEGRSPKAPGEYAFEWYNTPNRRFPSIADFLDLCRDKEVTVHHALYLNTAEHRRVEANEDPNLNADTAVMVLSR